MLRYRVSACSQRPSCVVLLAEERGWTCEIPVKDVAIMRKPL
jgi:hypothetical protein